MVSCFMCSSRIDRYGCLAVVLRSAFRSGQADAIGRDDRWLGRGCCMQARMVSEGTRTTHSDSGQGDLRDGRAVCPRSRLGDSHW